MADHIKERMKALGWQADEVCMVTLTIDPQAFPDPLEIFVWLKDCRYVAETVRALFRSGHLASPDFYCSIEFQMEGRNGSPPTEQVHFHVLVRSAKRGFLDYREVFNIWNRRVPHFRREGGTHSIGRVHVESGLRSVEGVSGYVNKYVCKAVDNLPEWFIEWAVSEDKSPRFHTSSRGFSVNQGATKTVNGDGDQQRTKRKYRGRMTFRQAIAKCRRDAAVFEVLDVMGGKKRRWVGKCPQSWEESVILLGIEDPEERIKAGSVGLRQGDVAVLLGGWHSSVECDTIPVESDTDGALWRAFKEWCGESSERVSRQNE